MILKKWQQQSAQATVFLYVGHRFCSYAKSEEPEKNMQITGLHFEKNGGSGFDTRIILEEQSH